MEDGVFSESPFKKNLNTCGKYFHGQGPKLQSHTLCEFENAWATLRTDGTGLLDDHLHGAFPGASLEGQ